MKTFRAERLFGMTAPLLLLLTGACKKAPAPAPAVVPAATTAAPTPTPAPAPAAATPPAAPGATLSDPVTADGVTIQCTLGDGKTVPWALKQAEIKDDPLGQWPSAATASSAYHDAKDQERFSPWQATGVPNIDQSGDNGNAWDPKTPHGGIEWLDVSYPKPSLATAVRVRESNNGGAIVKVDLIDEDGHVHALWTGTDPTKSLNYFILTFPKTAYKVAHVKLTLATNLIPGENEIDAVQLVTADK